MGLLSFLKAAPHKERLPADQVDGAYKKFRLQNFLAMFLGYAAYYLMRGNFSLAMPYLSQNGFSKTVLGVVLSALSVAYGISKFIMGNLSDRSNPRYFIAIGLVLSVGINLAFGWIPAVTTSLVCMYVLMFANGWVQGMGAPPCYRTAAHWFSARERGRIMSIWNVSHNIGAGILGALAVLIIPLLTWKSIFYVPSILVLIISIVVVFLMRDTPQSEGLMPIEEYRKEEKKAIDKNQEKELSAKEILFKYVLVNKYVWYLCFASIFVYFIRYGVLNWAPTYLAETKGVKISHAGLSFVIYEIAGILGILVSGYLSDKLFKGRRAPVSMLCMAMVAIGILLYWLSSNLIVSHLALLMIGMFIYGPIMLLGIQVLDIIPKKAVGTTVGLIGLFGYWGGTIAATAGFGLLVDKLGWQGGFITLLASCVLATFFFALTMRIKSGAKEEKVRAPLLKPSAGALVCTKEAEKAGVALKSKHAV